MKTIPPVLVACLCAAVVLAGCASRDGGSESTGDNQTGRELSTDVEVGGGDAGSTNATNETNETTDGTTSG